MLFSELLKNADQGHAAAQYEVALAYWRGCYIRNVSGTTINTKDVPDTIVVSIEEDVEKNIAKALEYLIKSMLNEFSAAHQWLTVILKDNTEVPAIFENVIKTFEPEVRKKVLIKLGLDKQVDQSVGDTRTDATISEDKQESKVVPKPQVVQLATSKESLFAVKTLRASKSEPKLPRLQLKVNPSIFASSRTL